MGWLLAMKTRVNHVCDSVVYGGGSLPALPRSDISSDEQMGSGSRQKALP